VWVTLAWLVRHPQWGTISLPLAARLYVRAQNMFLLRVLHGWIFRTKLELAAMLLEWAAGWLKYLGKTVWVVADGAYAKRPFLRRAKAACVTVVSRLRKDAALCSVPAAPRKGQRRRGFTLVEMSIVLVIIGLIIGAIAVGRDLIGAAKIRMQIAQIEKYRSAVNTFKTKYNNALPGDMTEEQADEVGFTVPPTRPNTGSTTHGNGFIEGGMGAEGITFWEDLSSAGLIGGTFTQGTEGWGSDSNATQATLGRFVPAAIVGNDTYIMAWALSVTGQNTVEGLPWPMSVSIPQGNYFMLLGIDHVDGTADPYYTNTLTPVQAQNIDSKIDDGVFYTGTVRAAWGGMAPWQTFVGGGVGGGNQCASIPGWGSDTFTGYQTNLYPDTPACQLSFAF
jgi:prepilin-type N-terminal cleavage/methylation domain-containing protein